MHHSLFLVFYSLTLGARAFEMDTLNSTLGFDDWWLELLYVEISFCAFSGEDITLLLVSVEHVYHLVCYSLYAAWSSTTFS